ncbi:cytochrome c3 family protein [Geobacter sp. DSM 9736]|uniref:cytochrome c3 family protein n=1 Tax=Geobacter sp. DSM 9736 TaxID=1277350 RepID=UPI000B501CE7|nr:cytochrome c3 family protein [Geobacter sp. DSM 9736]SNB48075.1 c(7)-type cytochrome triheme domain-containing protein [Geobacter sp. DSM 9736]
MKFRWLLLPAILVCCASNAAALELKDVTYDTKGGGKVVFSHKVHLKKKSPKSPNVSCKSCHNDNMKMKTRYSMADMEKGKSCGMCHGKTAFPLSNCTACHKVKDVTFKIRETGPVVFSHNRHLKEMQCDACHTKLYETGPNKRVTMAEMEKGKSCGACHNGKTAFSVAKCGACHPTRDVTFKVKEISNVKFSHDTHISMYKCGDCHNGVFKPATGNKPVSMTEMEKGKSCGKCHDGKTAFTVAANCDTCHHK